MPIRTVASHELRQVEMVTCIGGRIAEVRLRRNIAEVEDEDGTHWEADEVRGTVDAATSGTYVAAHFGDLWDEWDDTPLTRRIAEVRDVGNVHDDAIVELAEMAASNETDLETLTLAVLELADIVGGGE